MNAAERLLDAISRIPPHSRPTAAQPRASAQPRATNPSARRLVNNKLGTRDYSHRFREWMRERQALRGMTRQQLAEAAGLERGSIYALQRGNMIASREVAARVGRALDAEDEALLMAGFAPDGLRDALEAEIATLALDPDLRRALLDTLALDADDDLASVDLFLLSACSTMRACSTMPSPMLHPRPDPPDPARGGRPELERSPQR